MTAGSGSLSRPNRSTPLGLVLLAAGILLALVLPGDGTWRIVVVAVILPGAYLAVGRHLGGAAADRPPDDAPTVVLAPVVQGRRTAINGPTSKVPSHGTHGYARRANAQSAEL